MRFALKRHRNISDLTDHLGYWLRLVSNHVSHSFARKLEGNGVTTAEWVLMRVLYDVDALAPSRVAEQMGMTRGAISKLADRLVEKGLLARREDPDDKRAQSLSLTGDGRRLVPALARLADQNDEAFFRALTIAERRQLKGLLEKLVERHALMKPPVD